MDLRNIMEYKIRNSRVFLLLATTLNVADSATKILISRYTNWNYLVLGVFNKCNQFLFKISFSQDGTCPTFYLNFKLFPAPGGQYISN